MFDLNYFKRFSAKNPVFLNFCSEGQVSLVLGQGCSFISVLDDQFLPLRRAKTLEKHIAVDRIAYMANLIKPAGRGAAIVSPPIQKNWDRRKAILSIDWVNVDTVPDVGGRERSFDAVAVERRLDPVRLIDLFGPPDVLADLSGAARLLAGTRPAVSYFNAKVFASESEKSADAEALKMALGRLSAAGYQVFDLYLTPCGAAEIGPEADIASGFLALHREDPVLDDILSAETKEQILLDSFKMSRISQQRNPARGAQETGPKTIFVTFPRSGHNLLIDTLDKLAGVLTEYCNFYDCTRGGTAQPTCAETRNEVRERGICPSGMRYQRSHDFGLDLPVIPAQRYVVQYRHPVESICSWYDIATEFWPLEEDSALNFQIFFAEKLAFWDGFMKKWVIPGSCAPNVFRIGYDQLLENHKVLWDLLEYIDCSADVSEMMLRDIGRTMCRRKSVVEHRHFDRKLFASTEAARIDVLRQAGIDPLFTD